MGEEENISKIQERLMKRDYGSARRVHRDVDSRYRLQLNGNVAGASLLPLPEAPPLRSILSPLPDHGCEADVDEGGVEVDENVVGMV